MAGKFTSIFILGLLGVVSDDSSFVILVKKAHDEKLFEFTREVGVVTPSSIYSSSTFVHL